MIELTAPWQALVAEITGEAHAGAPRLLRALHASTAAAALLGQLVDGVDSENRETELLQLRSQASAALTTITAKLRLGRVGEWAMAALVPIAMPKAFDLAAAQSAAIEKFRDDRLVPALTEGIKFAAALRLAVAPDAQPVGV